MFLLKDTYPFWQCVQNLVCLFINERMFNETIWFDESTLCIDSGIYLLKTINRLFTQNTTKYENPWYHALSDFVLIRMLNHINLYLHKNLRWDLQGNIGVYRDERGCVVWEE